jgi:hypothetical protein
MRQSYRNHRQFVREQMEQEADRYMDGLQKAGLPPNARLTRAMAERASNKAEERYREHVSETFYQNTQHIMRTHKREMNQIKREGTRFGLKVILPIALFLGGLAWYSYGHPGWFIPGAWICYAAFALALLSILALGAIFNRPERVD